MRVKSGLAEMLKGGVIMDVTNAEQARIAEDAGACAVMALERVPAGHPPRRRRRPHVRPRQDPRDPGDGDDPGDGQGPHRPLRRGADAAGARGRLHRRVRGADARRRGQPHRQVEVHGAVRVRRDQPRRGAAAHRRGRGHDPLQGRGRHRQRGRGRAPHALDPRRDQAAARRWTRTSCTRRQGSARPLRAGPLLRRERPAAGGHVHGRRHRHAGRRGDDDAARRRRRVRRLGHLQERRPRAARRGDRQGHAPTSATRPIAGRGLERASASAMVGIEISELGEDGLLQTRGW